MEKIAWLPRQNVVLIKDQQIRIVVVTVSLVTVTTVVATIHIAVQRIEITTMTILVS